ncbi:hypothetical protein GFS24_02650 [Chitinophaga sp. SYP-B3965]|uniref:helix-turn-helix domain-containing protein n=1 Tax=Chitinophaga sp. SYP-B3965 TaxID=2663120 RepID=UPI001299F0E3|nr:hypothetical protein [Chitinophaga sp. SYP-B3965]MRG43993.1 hypothetical protein [Chitinophaga sp. SYP-B3965]
MEPLKYKVIKTEKQYYEYCNLLEELAFLKDQSAPQRDLVELLIVLIERYDEEHNTFEEPDPVVMLRSFMEDFKMKSVDMAKMLSVSPSLISDVLNYRRGFSKEMIRKLSERFKVNQSLFNRPYALVKPKAKKATSKKATKSPAKKAAKAPAPKSAKPKPPAKKSTKPPTDPPVRIRVTRIKKSTKAKA